MSSTILAIYIVTCAVPTNHSTVTFNLLYPYSIPLDLIVLMGYHLLPVFSLSLTPPSFCVIPLHCYLLFLDCFGFFGYRFDLLHTSLCRLFLENVMARLTYYRLLYLCSQVLLSGDQPSNPIYRIISLTISPGSITSSTLHSYGHSPK